MNCNSVGGHLSDRVSEGRVDKNGEVWCGTCKGNPYFMRFVENGTKRLLFRFNFVFPEYKLKVGIAQLFGT